MSRMTASDLRGVSESLLRPLYNRASATGGWMVRCHARGGEQPRVQAQEQPAHD
jgi:hypothetical protein